MTPLTKYATADQGDPKFTVLWLLLKRISIKKKSYIVKLYNPITTPWYKK
jgi:hypothetical protein